MCVVRNSGGVRAYPTPWGVPVEILAVNTDEHEGSPCVTADKRTIYFDTDRDGTYDIYATQRASTADPFPAPAPVAEVNTDNTSEQDPWISLDSRRLVFSSNRSGTNQVWQATR